MTATFTHAGRRHTLWKRTEGAGAAWWFTFQRSGRRYVQSLRTAELEQARHKAALLLEAHARGELEAMRQVLHPAAPAAAVMPCTVGQALAWFEKAPLPIRPATRAGYMNALKRVLSDQPGPLATLSAAVLNHCVRPYLERATKAAGAESEQYLANRIKRSALSDLNQAKALLSPANVEDMRADGLEVPDLAPFHAAITTRGRRFGKGLGNRLERLPADDLIARTVEEWRSLSNWNEFVAVGLMLSCGLRTSTIAQARHDWFTERNGEPCLHAAANTKDGSGEVFIRPIDPYWSTLFEAIAIQESRLGVHKLSNLLTGPASERQHEVFRRTSGWLRRLGWQTQKTNHALRAYAIGTVILKYGLEAARDFAGHKQSSTTEGRYGYLIKPGQRTLAADQIKIEWAK